MSVVTWTSSEIVNNWWWSLMFFGGSWIMKLTIMIGCINVSAALNGARWDGWYKMFARSMFKSNSDLLFNRQMNIFGILHLYVLQSWKPLLISFCPIKDCIMASQSLTTSSNWRKSDAINFRKDTPTLYDTIPSTVIYAWRTKNHPFLVPGELIL